MKVTLLNPYYDEEIEVLEDLDYFNKSYENMLKGNEESIRLTQIKFMDGMGGIKSSDKRIIFINPRHWAKVEVEEWIK